MKFGISITVDGRNVRLQVQRVFTSDLFERFEIIARNKTLIIESNRPLLRRKGLKHREPDYKLVSGLMHSTWIVDKIIKELKATLENREDK